MNNFKTNQSFILKLFLIYYIRIRAGRAAEAAAARRRAGEAAAARARAQLTAYWDKHKTTASGNGLPQRLTGSYYYSIAEDQARILAQKRQKQRYII